MSSPAMVVYGDARFYRETTNVAPRMPLRAGVAIAFAMDKCWRMQVQRYSPRESLYGYDVYSAGMVTITAINIDPAQESALEEHGFRRINVSHSGGPRRNGPRVHMRYTAEVDT